MRKSLQQRVGSSPNNVGSDDLSLSAELLKELAAPIIRSEKVQEPIGRAARRSGIAYWRTYDLWYRKARRIEPHEKSQIAEAVERKRREAIRNEFHDLRTRLAILESRLAQTDADFHREDIDRLREQGGGFGGVRRPLASGA